jgi:hypothetical protein
MVYSNDELLALMEHGRMYPFHISHYSNILQARLIIESALILYDLSPLLLIPSIF